MVRGARPRVVRKSDKSPARGPTMLQHSMGSMLSKPFWEGCGYCHTLKRTLTLLISNCRTLSMNVGVIVRIIMFPHDWQNWKNMFAKTALCSEKL